MGRIVERDFRTLAILKDWDLEFEMVIKAKGGGLVQCDRPRPTVSSALALQPHSDANS